MYVGTFSYAAILNASSGKVPLFFSIVILFMLLTSSVV